MAKQLIYKKRPSSFIAALNELFAFRKKTTNRIPQPQITAEFENFTIDRTHLKKFIDICGIENKNRIPLLYPYTLIFPLYIRMLVQKETPLALWRVLNTRIKILQRREIKINETLSIFSRTTECRPVNKGLEMDIFSEIKSGGITVWENLNTFFYPGRFGDQKDIISAPQLYPAESENIISQWFLPDGPGYTFSKISGDNNPIHYLKFYARLLGFKAHFAQPILVLGNSIRTLDELKYKDGESVYLEAHLKGPVYYNNNILLKGKSDIKRHRFDIFCGSNPRRSIETEIKAVSADSNINVKLPVYPDF